MLTLDNLSQQIAEYRRGYISLDDFEDWFRDNSRGAYNIPGISEVCASVEAALSKFYFQAMDESGLKAELVNAVLPFVQPIAENRYGDPSFLPTPETNAKSESNRVAA